MKMKLLMAPFALLCPMHAEAMVDITKDIDEFVKEPIEYFKAHRDRYEWVDKNTLDVLCQLPPLKDVESKFREFEKSRQAENQIDLGKVRSNVKAFYKKLFNDSELGKYLLNVANTAIDRAQLFYKTKVVGGESEMVPVVQSIEDAPPYLRIRPLAKQYYERLDDIKTDKKLSSEEVDELIKQRAREKFPEYAEYDISVPHCCVGASLIEDIQVKFDNSGVIKKVYENQPDFHEIESEEKGYRVIYEDDDVSEAIIDGLHNVSETLIKEESEDNKKFKYEDPDDQKKYDEWFEKIANKLGDPAKVAENYMAKIGYISQDSAEAHLIHEIAHIVEYAYILKTGQKKKNTNVETVSVYIEALKGGFSVERLFELYNSVFCIVRSDLLRTKFKHLFKANNGEKNSIWTDEQLKICEQIEAEYIQINTSMNKGREYLSMFQLDKNGEASTASSIMHDTEAEFLQNEFSCLSEHIEALNNAIKLKGNKPHVLQALDELTHEQVAEVTPDSFNQMLKYLLS